MSVTIPRQFGRYTVERIVGDDRLQRLADLTGDHHVYGGMKDNRIEALFKPRFDRRRRCLR